MYVYRYILLAVLSIWITTLYAQDYITVSDIKVSGNKKTKTQHILRLLDLEKGDTMDIATIGKRLEKNMELLLSTSLFSQADANISKWDTDKKEIDLRIKVQEGLFIYPYVVFEVADRNINVWLDNHWLDFSRTNYGLGVSHINLFGFNDQLKVYAQRGYTTKYQASYYRPLFYKKIGLFGEIFYADYHEMPYATYENKLEFTSNPEREAIWFRRRATIGIDYQHSTYENHELLTYFYHDNIASTFEEYSSNFFGESRRKQRMMALEYTYTLDNRPYKVYPYRGNFLEIKLKKEGLGIFKEYNNMACEVNYEHYIPWTPKWSSSHKLRGKTLLNKTDLPYYNKKAVGYEEAIIRGYELYVIDGSDYLIHSSSLHYKAFSNTIDWGSLMFIKPLKKMQTDVHLRFSLDQGYVYDLDADPENFLNNRFLYGGGVGVDVVLYHIAALSLEYNVNHLKEGKIYIKVDANF